MTKIPFLHVSRGRLICDRVGKRKKRVSFTATLKGARAMGRWLSRAGVPMWLYSSSVDFCQDYGGDDVDLRSAVEEAYSAE